MYPIDSVSKTFDIIAKIHLLKTLWSNSSRDEIIKQSNLRVHRSDIKIQLAIRMVTTEIRYKNNCEMVILDIHAMPIPVFSSKSN